MSIRSVPYNPSRHTKRKRTLSPSSSIRKTKKKYNDITIDTIGTHLQIFRRFITNLQIRENILNHNNNGVFSIGPTILDIPNDYLNIITENKKYKNYVFINSSFKLPNASKGTIFIKTSNDNNNVHICSYIFNNNKIVIFDPAWHPVNKKGEYSEDKFYDDLQKRIKKNKLNYSVEIVHTGGDKSIQNHLGNDVFCQSWSLKWLLNDGINMTFPNSVNTAVSQLINILQDLSRLINTDFIYLLPKEKWEIDMDVNNITQHMIKNKWDDVVYIIQHKLTNKIMKDLYNFK